MTNTPAHIHGPFPFLKNRRADSRDSLLIERRTAKGENDPAFGVIAVRPSDARRLSLYLEPNLPGTIYQLTLYPFKLSPVRIGEFRLWAGETYDIMAILDCPEGIVERVGSTFVSADMRQARRIAAAAFGSNGEEPPVLAGTIAPSAPVEPEMTAPEIVPDPTTDSVPEFEMSEK
jgi:hypothetical protein